MGRSGFCVGAGDGGVVGNAGGASGGGRHGWFCWWQSVHDVVVVTMESWLVGARVGTQVGIRRGLALACRLCVAAQDLEAFPFSYWEKAV